MNENVFSGKAEVYMQCRPRYAQGALELIRRETSLTPDSLIADIGAGTGIFTGQLMALGCRVAAVEPNADMRSRIAETAPGAEIISAPAEHTGLPDCSVSLITAAESFHWFQQEDFRKECRRILRPDGKVMIVWNLTDKKTETVRLLHELNLKHCEQYRALFANGRTLERERFAEISESFLKSFSTASFKNDLSYDKAQFIGNRISSSYAPKPGDPEFDDYRTALEAFFEQHQQNGVIVIPNNTVCFIGKA